MPHPDAPYWEAPPEVLAAIAQHAPFIRGLVEGTWEKLAEEGVEFNSRLSFASEVLASVVNLLADQAAERRKDQSPERQLHHAGYVNIIVSDIMNRAQLRRLRGED